MSKQAFWPGYKWRILAHCVQKPGPRAVYTGHQITVDSNAMRAPVEFDELVIDDWFHLEQMSDRHWWIGLGNGDDYWHLGVSVDRDGKATVSMEKQ